MPSNPFRSTTATPNVTGANTTTSASSASSDPPPSDHNQPPRNENLSFITDEEPPEYTPAPDPTLGEHTVEYGPSRPFQSAPAARPAPAPSAAPQPQRTGYGQTLSPQATGFGLGSSSGWGGGLLSSRTSSRRGGGGGILHQLADQLIRTIDNAVTPPPSNNRYAGLSPQPTGGAGVRPQSTGGGWSGYPGQQAHLGPPPQRPSQTPTTTTSNAHLPPPPPRHPSSLSALSAPASPSSERRAVSASSDFAREFYAAGTGEGVIGDDNDGVNMPGAYAPPPGPPPNSAAASGSSRSAPARDKDDGKPTTRPVPGHPLLNNGKTLMYPKGYLCGKCHNTGYKSFDPSNPCKKCWSKYAKSYSGPLVYAFEPSNPNAPLNKDTTLQRPLPRTGSGSGGGRPRALSHQSGGGSYFAPSPSTYTPSGPPPNPSQSYFPPQPPPQQQPQVLTISPHASDRPPPGSIVYPAGDPRIGGTLCWHCTGDGNISLFLFDRETCPTCGGIGRIFGPTTRPTFG